MTPDRHRLSAQAIQPTLDQRPAGIASSLRRLRSHASLRGAAGRQRLVVAGFVAGLLLPTLDHLLRPSSARDPTPEERRAAPFPEWEWSLGAIDALPRRLGKWFDDRLGWRDRLLCWNSLVQLEVFGRFPSRAMYTGTDGWWFYAEGDALEVWRGLRPFRDDELDSWCKAMEEQRDWLRERGVEFLFVIAPNKETIYPEHVPACHERLGPTRMDQFAAYLHAHSDVPFLDLRPALLAEKRFDAGDDLLYYRLGTHWTDRGSWIAYREILRALQPRVPCLIVPELSDFVVTSTDAQGDTWAGRVYAPDVYRQACRVYTPRAGYATLEVPRPGRTGEIQRARDGAACASSLLLHDSFGYKVDNFLMEHFGHQLQCARTTLEEAIVDEARPEVVIEIFAESKLRNAPPRLERRQDPAANRVRFEASGTRLFLWEGGHGRDGIEGWAGAALAPAADGPGCRITTRTASQGFLSPELPFPRDCASILKLTLEVREAQVVDVLYRREEDSEYDRSRTFQLELRPGRNEIHQRLDGRDWAGRLRFRPRLPGELVLRELELREDRSEPSTRRP